MVRFLHTADWQIGKPYNRLPEGQKRFRLQQERLQVIGRIAAVAHQEQVAFVLVAGDLFDSPTVPADAVLEVLEAVGTLAMPVLVIPGNHDHGAPGSVWHRQDFLRQQQRRAPNLVLLLERQPLLSEAAVVLPCPLLRNQDSADPAAWLHSFDWSTLPADLPRIVLAHGGIQGFSGRDYGGTSGGDEEAPAGAVNRLNLAAIDATQVDYIALGDWHNGQQVSPKGWYAGTPEPDRFDQGDDNQRGQVLVVEVNRGDAPKVAVIPTGRIGWHNLRFHFSADSDLDRFERLVRQRIADRVARDLLRLEVSGSLSLAGHARWNRLMADLRDQLLRVRVKGHCDQAPGEEELAALVGRNGDPLIAAVAQQLQQRLQQICLVDSPQGDGSEAAGGTSPDPASPAAASEEEAAILRLALCELHRLAAAAEA
jgi:DNA repair exonuclease SbcCD nuclease subunit